MLPLVLLICQIWRKITAIGIQLKMDTLEIKYAVNESVKSCAEESFNPSALSFRFLVFQDVGDW